MSIETKKYLVAYSEGGEVFELAESDAPTPEQAALEHYSGMELQTGTVRVYHLKGILFEDDSMKKMVNDELFLRGLAKGEAPEGGWPRGSDMDLL